MAACTPSQRDTLCAMWFWMQVPPGIGRRGSDCAEDLRHFLEECPAYDHIRDQFPDVFAFRHGQTVEAWLQTVFSGDHQGQLAHCVFQSDMLRRVLLGKGITNGGTPRQQPLGYIPSLSHPACLQAGRNARADAGFAMLAGFNFCCIGVCRAVICSVSQWRGVGCILAPVTCWWAGCRLNTAPE
jgi:hypothetical protein